MIYDKLNIQEAGDTHACVEIISGHDILEKKFHFSGTSKKCTQLSIQLGI